MSAQSRLPVAVHDDVIKWKHFRRYWPFVWGIHRSSVNSPLKGQWRGALVFSLIYVWINGWVHNHDAGDLRRHHAHLDVTVIGDGMALANRKRITHWNGNAVLTNLLSPWSLATQEVVIVTTFCATSDGNNLSVSGWQWKQRCNSILWEYGVVVGNAVYIYWDHFSVYWSIDTLIKKRNSIVNISDTDTWVHQLEPIKAHHFISHGVSPFVLEACQTRLLHNLLAQLLTTGSLPALRIAQGTASELRTLQSTQYTVQIMFPQYIFRPTNQTSCHSSHL